MAVEDTTYAPSVRIPAGPPRRAAGPGRDAPAGAPGGWRRARRVMLIAALIALVPALASYVSTVTGPSNSSLGIRTVEWLRGHGLAGLVSGVESVYYSINAPSKGGPGLKALPQVGFGRPVSERARRASVTGTAGATGAVALHYTPPRVRAVIHPALRGEGVWRSASPGRSAFPPVLVTTFRADPSYPRLVAGVGWIDHTQTRVSLFPGIQEPSTSGVPRGTEDVPTSVRRNLVATFNSGFRMSDGAGGFALHGHTYAPLKHGLATIIRYADGRVDVRAWGGGSQAPRGIVFARQNLPLIVNYGRLNPNLSDGPEWGATLGNAIRVWRSGVGVDRHGNLMYAAADSQTVGSMAQILRHAGAVRALELDINSYWTSFITYHHRGGLDPVNLLPSMTRSASRYLSPDDRDFFAVFARPGALLAAQRTGKK